MSGGTEALYAAIEESARLVGSECSREAVWPTLVAYGEALDGSAVVFSVQNGGDHAGELEYTMQVPQGIEDPYAHALTHGFIAATDHPAGALFTELKQRVTTDAHGVDYGVASGFKKVYALFGRDSQAVPALTAIPAMPAALADNAELLASCGLDTAVSLGIDYQNRTMNVYFQLARPGSLEPKTVLTLLGEMGLSNPDQRMVDFASTAYRVYFTLSWATSTIQRISFAPLARPGVDLSALPARMEPEIERFMKEAPYAYEGDRVGATVVKWSPDGGFLDFGSYYRISPAQLKAATAAR